MFDRYRLFIIIGLAVLWMVTMGAMGYLAGHAPSPSRVIIVKIEGPIEVRLVP
jgi:hypothetical protein